MVGLGTLINFALIILGGLIGLLLGKKLNAGIRDSLIAVIGVAVMLLGIAGALPLLFSSTSETVAGNTSLMLVVCLALGTVLGEICHIDGGIERFGAWLKRKTHNEQDGSFVSDFVSASCTVCIGAMAIVGSIEDALFGDYSTLLVKGILDFVIVMVLCASSGRGAIFSAVPVFLFQGTVTLLALPLGNFLPDASLTALSSVGSALIFCVGVNLVFDRHIRVANALPALILAAAWPLLPI